MTEQDYTKLPREVADTIKRGGYPLSEEQYMLMCGALAAWQSITTQELAARDEVIKGLEKDAARYRYMRTHNSFSGIDKNRLEWYLPRTYGTGKSPSEQLDDSIDEALNAYKGKDDDL